MAYKIILATFIPSAVEPAHPPINIKNNSINLDSVGYLVISYIENPVVVITEETLKKALCNAVLYEIVLYSLVKEFIDINITDTDTIIK